MPDESTLRERLEELEGAMRIISQYTTDPWVRELVERILDDD
jgi:hypothetical protein